MKIKSSIPNEAQKADKKENYKELASESRKQALAGQNDKAGNKNQIDFLNKEEAKFANILEPTPKPQKPVEKQSDPGEENRDDQKKERQKTENEKQNLIETSRFEKNEKRDSFGGQSGFGSGGNIGQTALNENFAARSILHIADLERLVSTIRMQTQLNGKREIILQLKHSIMEGLQVKILTDPACACADRIPCRK